MKENNKKDIYNATKVQFHWLYHLETVPLTRFTLASTYRTFTTARSEVVWHRLVWFSKAKTTFILWLAIKNRLGTQDRLHTTLSDPKCLLCNTQIETHRHLFFDCNISQHIWTIVLRKCHSAFQSMNWEDYIAWLSGQWKGNSLMVTIRKLCLASTVYTIWVERNSRYHNNNFRGTNSIIATILELVRLKLSTLSKVKDNAFNQSIQQDWGIPPSIFT